MDESRNTAREIAQDKTNLDIMKALGELNGEMKGIRTDIKQTLDKIEDHETRISTNESDLAGIKVKVAVIGALIGAAISAVGNWIWSRVFGHG